MFSVENAGESWAALQRAVDRIVAIIRANPQQQRMDRIITRWLKRHLQRLGTDVGLEQLESLVEDRGMLAENLENLVKRERQEGRYEGRQEGYRETARRLIVLGTLSDEQIAHATELTVDDIRRLRAEEGG